MAERLAQEMARFARAEVAAEQSAHEATREKLAAAEIARDGAERAHAALLNAVKHIPKPTITLDGKQALATRALMYGAELLVAMGCDCSYLLFKSGPSYGADHLVKPNDIVFLLEGDDFYHVPPATGGGSYD